MNKKNVGLITYHASHNMGSILQTYAMRYILEKKFNCSVDIINFSSEGQRNLYSFYSKQGGIKGLLKNIIILLFYPMFKKRYLDFEKTIKNFFNLDKRQLKYTEELKGIFDKYDVVITGSDQVWNLSCSDYDDAYFIPFKTKAAKISYAPSFGGKNILNDKDKLDKLKEYLSDFKSISIREKNGQKWLKELTGQDYPLVADPTLLVEHSVYDCLASEREYQGDYIFFYGVPFSSRTYSVLKIISKKYNMPVVMLDIKPWVFRGNFFRGFKLSRNSTPNSYLSLIKHSKFVITTSFHGSIFSTIFRKNFWQLTFRSTNPDDDRLDTLLYQLGIPERKVYMDEVNEIDFYKDIDFDSVSKNIIPLKNVSWEYLHNSLGD